MAAKLYDKQQAICAGISKFLRLAVKLADCGVGTAARNVSSAIYIVCILPSLSVGFLPDDDEQFRVDEVASAVVAYTST